MHLAIIALMAIALAGLGFGHKAARADTLALEATLLTFGGDICGETTEHQHGSSCEACRIADAASLSAQTVAAPRPDLVALYCTRSTYRAPLSAATGAPPARAPPA